MDNNIPEIEELIKQFSRLPGLGPKSAKRIILKLINNNQNAFLALKIVEIIGEDEPHQLDPETIYFITNLLNKMNLKQIRNLVFNSALPLRA